MISSCHPLPSEDPQSITCFHVIGSILFIRFHSFMFTTKLRRRYRYFPYTPDPTCIASSIIISLSRMVHISPRMKHHHYSKSIAHVRVLPPFKPPLELEEPFSNVIWRFALYVIHTHLACLQNPWLVGG